MRTTWTLTRKDMRLLTRSRVLMVLLLTYPIVIAVLLGMAYISQSGAQTVAIVNEAGVSSITLGDKEFVVEEYLEEVIDEIDIDFYDSKTEALRALDDGQIEGVFVIPKSFQRTAESGIKPAEVTFYAGDNALGDLIAERARGAVYLLNQDLSKAAVETNADYIRKIVTGGEVEALGQTYSLLGLQPSVETLEKMLTETDDEALQGELQDIITFANEAGTAMEFSEGALEATANPVTLERVEAASKSPALTSRAMSIVLAMVLALMCTVIVASMTAAESDDGVLGRLLQGSVTRTQLLSSKLLLGTILGVLLTAGLFVAFGLLESQAWERLPLLLGTVIVSGLAFSALGAVIATLTGDSRTATLSAVMLVLPLIPLAAAFDLQVAQWLSALFPFAPSAELFNAVLFEVDPWRDVAVGVAHLLALALAMGMLARATLQRLT